MKTFTLIIVFALAGCSTNDKVAFNNYLKSYEFKDLSGNFSLVEESGLNKKKKEVFLKRKLINVSDNKVYEKGIVISHLGVLRTKEKKLRVLRPKISQYSVWFDKEKFFSQIEVLPTEKLLKVSMSSPEKKWNGIKTFKFLNSKGIFCYFSQIVDCLNVTGFLTSSRVQEQGSISFTIIWDGFPYIVDQYDGIGRSPFSSAKMVFDSKTKNGLYKFNLTFSDQIIFYHINKENVLEKRFWVSQGLTQMSL